jgi:acetyl esterase
MLDPEIAQMLKAMQDNGEPPLFEDTTTGPEARQRGIDIRARYYPPVLKDVARVDEQSIPGPAGDIPCRVYRPENPTGATVVFFHGGGWIVGDLDSHDGHARRLTATARAVVVHVEYRLAPENPFPAGYLDAVAATDWVYDHVDELGGRADLIALAGDSAGGNLAASVAVHCRDTGRPLAGQLLIYPAVDLAAGLGVAYPKVDSAGGLAGAQENPEGGSFAGQVDDWVERQYLGNDLSQTIDPRVSPMHAPSHAGLAPAIIGIGHHDPLLDQNIAYAKVLFAAGVPTVLREYPDLIHGFFGMGGVSRSADSAADQLCRDLRELLTEQTTTPPGSS